MRPEQFFGCSTGEMVADFVGYSRLDGADESMLA
jgi:hypothetical protein